MLDDLFSHKIHATDIDEWSLTLVRLAQVYEQLDGRPYDRDQLEDRLALLAPHARRSAFRDQFSIYMSILGVGQIVWDGRGWRVRVSETARQFLLGVEPDIEAFCRLQLALYQRPDGRGLSYENAGRHDHLSAAAKLDMIREGYRVCPFRLILGMIGAKAKLNGVGEADVEVTPEEIYALVNDPKIRVIPNPTTEVLIDGFNRFRRGRIEAPNIGRKTFKFLESTGLVTTDAHANIRLRDWGNDAANAMRDRQVATIRGLRSFFDRFNHCTSVEGLVGELKSGRWAGYFDAVKTLPPALVETIAGRGGDARIVVRGEPWLPAQVRIENQPTAPAASVITERDRRRRAARAPRALADPEETRILRERRNAFHDLIVQRLAAKIRENQLQPHSTAFIDVFANVDSIRNSLPGRFTTRGSYLENQVLPYYPAGEIDELSFLFEVKSSDDRIVVDQVRKAVGQLYEYRYRYSNIALKHHVVLVVALQRHLRDFPWIAQYLLTDRRIGVCWLDEDLERIMCPRECMPVLQPFVDGAA